MTLPIEEIYGGQYLKSQIVISRGLSGKSLKISNVEVETAFDKQRIILSFHDLNERLSLKKSNAYALAESFGSDYLKWIEKDVSLSVEKLDSGKDSIKVTPIKGA